jgi:hypothetical protein
MTELLLKLLSESLRQAEYSLGPVLRRLNEWSAAAAPYLQAFRKWDRAVDAVNAVGWLPYRSEPPLRLMEECGDDFVLLNKRFSNYYRTRWSEIRDDMKSRLADYHIDDEARETFREALSAHEGGHYRCVCRVLFPEIERMIGVGRRKTDMLEKLTGTRDLADLAFRERFGLILFDRLVDHMYEDVGDKREKFERDPVPNRHAAMHGLVQYSTHKHSMNMLILTDYVFEILPPITEADGARTEAT